MPCYVGMIHGVLAVSARHNVFCRGQTVNGILFRSPFQRLKGMRAQKTEKHEQQLRVAMENRAKCKRLRLRRWMLISLHGHCLQGSQAAARVRHPLGRVFTGMRSGLRLLGGHLTGLRGSRF